MAPDVAARLAEHLGDDELTQRELEVLSLIREGFRNKSVRTDADEVGDLEVDVADPGRGGHRLRHGGSL